MVALRAKAGPERAARAARPYIHDHWRDHVYGLAATHEIEIHVPHCHPRSRSALTLHWFTEEKGRGRAYRDVAHQAFFVEGLNLADERVLREAAQEASLDANEAIVAAWDPQRITGLRAMREEAKSIGVKGVPTVATAERILYYGAASPGKIRTLLTSQREIAS
jgi:predicted DsbA family dithiol-disulfide isomerase